MKKNELKRIYLFDDASEGKKTKIITDRLDELRASHFWDEYITSTYSNSFEAYVRDKVFVSGRWESARSNELIGDNQYTKDLLIKTLNKAIKLQETAILVDYYMIDNPTGETAETALRWIEDLLKKNKDVLKNSHTRILFYSAWPNPKMTRSITSLKNPNLYYSKLDFRNDLEIVEYDLEEFFRVVRINEDEE